MISHWRWLQVHIIKTTLRYILLPDCREAKLPHINHAPPPKSTCLALCLKPPTNTLVHSHAFKASIVDMHQLRLKPGCHRVSGAGQIC